MFRYSIHDLIILVISLGLVPAAIYIAVIDPNYRQSFMDISYVFLGGIVGSRIPNDRVTHRRRIH
jgi:hypothetical protein